MLNKCAFPLRTPFSGLPIFRSMSDRRQGAEDYHISGIKSAMPGTSTSSSSRGGDGLQSQYTRDEAQAKETQYTLLTLVSNVREHPILYDIDVQSSIPDAQLRRQKREAWDRIRGDMMWQNMNTVQDVWEDLLDQYSRKSDELSDSIIDSLRWTDVFLSKKKSDSRPPSQLNNMASGLEKDFFGEIPMGDDVLVSGQRIGSPTAINIMREYVVIQPTRRIASIDSPNAHNSHPTQQYVRRKTPEARETEAVVRTYPLATKRASTSVRTVNVHEVEHKGHKAQSQDSKKDFRGEPSTTTATYVRPGVLIEVEPGYAPPNQKMYKVVSGQRNTPPGVAGNSGRKIIGVFQMPRGNSLNYESVPPEPLIESPGRPSEPPMKKKMHMDNQHRSLSMSSSPSITVIPKNRDTLASVLMAQRQPEKILPDGIPIADDEIILETDGESLRECKPFGSGAENILGSRGQGGSHDMPSTSADDMNHYHHEEIEDGGVVEDIGQQVVVDGQPDDMAIQYDEDLAFQQHINSVLNRLTDDEKTMMKFNMQKIILDAKFGAGFARNMLNRDEMMEVQTHVEIDPNQDGNEVHI